MDSPFMDALSSGSSPPETKVRIFAAAKKLFTTKSYESVSMRQIAAAASANVSLVNRYFGSKEALFTSVVHELFSRKEAYATFEQMREGLLGNVGDFLQGDRTNIVLPVLRILLFSTFSPAVAHIVRDSFSSHYMQFAVSTLPAPQKRERALALFCYLTGLMVLQQVFTQELSQKSVANYMMGELNALLDRIGSK